MLKRFLLILVLTGVALAQVPSRQEFLRAVNDFERDPLSSQVDAQVNLMVKYSVESPDVEITISPVNFPVIEENPPKEVAVYLMGAFAGGNGRAQLQLNRKGDRSYEGVRLMLKAYRALQKKAPAYSSPGLEKLATLEKQGKLKKYLEDNVKKAPGK